MLKERKQENVRVYQIQNQRVQSNDFKSTTAVARNVFENIEQNLRRCWVEKVARRDYQQKK